MSSAFSPCPCLELLWLQKFALTHFIILGNTFHIRLRKDLEPILYQGLGLILLPDGLAATTALFDTENFLDSIQYLCVDGSGGSHNPNILFQGTALAKIQSFPICISNHPTSFSND